MRNSFLAGVALVLPFLVTGWVIWLVVAFIDGNVVPLLPPGLRPVAESIPGAGVMFALVGLTLVGALAGNLFGRWIVDAADRFISNLPLVRSIYGGAKQIFKQVAAPERTSFKQAVLVEFPNPGAWAIGFITMKTPPKSRTISARNWWRSMCRKRQSQPRASCFTFPAPAFARSQSAPEEALKRVISLGIIRDAEADARLAPPK